MKTIKKIDLINRIANGTEPERFIDNNILWYKGKSDKEHYYGEGGKYQLNIIRLDELNDEIELFDEEDEYEPFEEDKKIEKINRLEILDWEAFKIMTAGDKYELYKNIITIMNVFIDCINKSFEDDDLIDKVNNMENKQ